MTCALFANFIEWKTEREGRCAWIILDKFCFPFPSLWLWNLTLDRSTWLLFNFALFLHWIGAAQRPNFINQFVVVVIVVVQWKAARCRIHLRPVMVRYGLAKLLRGVKALQTRKKICKWFWKLTPAWTCKPFWKVHFVAVVVVWLTEFAWKLRSNIKKFQTKICCFFVAAGLVFSVFFFLLFRR